MMVIQRGPPETSMPTPRYALGVAIASNEKVYAIGGHNGLNVLSTVEEYDPLIRYLDFPAAVYANR